MGPIWPSREVCSGAGEVVRVVVWAGQRGIWRDFADLGYGLVLIWLFQFLNPATS